MQWNKSKDEPLTILKQRIAIDLDSLDYWDLYSVVDRLIMDGYQPELFRTRHGYHIVVRLEQIIDSPLGFWSLLKLRRHYGDDPQRINCDIMRITEGYPADVLFSQKGEYERIPKSI